MKKLFFGTAAAAFVAGASLLSPTAAYAAPEIPCETAKLIVPWKAGGGTHILFSIFEKTIQEMGLKPKLKVVTVPGQGGNKGAKEAAKAKADGCTLFAIHQSAMTSYLNGRIKFHYDNFETVALLTSTPDIVGASGEVAWNSFAEFQKAALAAPGTIKVGATFGSTSQFYWLILEERTGMKFKFVPYDGTRERMTAILSGAIDITISPDLEGHEAIAHAVHTVYDIRNDDCTFRTTWMFNDEERGAAFDRLRTEYPSHREFRAATVHLSSTHAQLIPLLKGLGFSLAEA